MLKKKWLQKSESCRKKLPLQRFEAGAQPDPLSDRCKLFYQPNKKQDGKHPGKADCPATHWRRWSRKGWSAFASLRRCMWRSGSSPSAMSILLARDAGCVRAACRHGRRPPVRWRIGEVGIIGEPDGSRRAAPSRTPRFSTGKPRPRRLSRLWKSALRLAPSVDVRERGGKGSAGRHLHPGRLFRPDDGPSQRHRLHRCTHRAPVPLASGRSRLHFGRRSAGRRAGRRGLRRGGQYPHGSAAGRPTCVSRVRAASTGMLTPTFRAP